MPKPHPEEYSNIVLIFVRSCGKFGNGSGRYVKSVVTSSEKGQEIVSYEYRNLWYNRTYTYLSRFDFTVVEIMGYNYLKKKINISLGRVQDLLSNSRLIFGPLTQWYEEWYPERLVEKNRAAKVE